MRPILFLLSLLAVGCATLPRAHDFRDEVDGGVYQYNGTIDFGEVDDEHTASALAALAAEADGGTKDATLRINSPGGEIFAGLEFVRNVTDLKKRTGLRVTCVVDGMAASMAAVILESPVCDARLMTKSSLLLFHNGSTMAKGTALELESELQLLQAMNTALAGLVAERLGIPEAQYRAQIEGKNWVLAAPEALHWHAVDNTVSNAAVAPPAELPQVTPPIPTINLSPL